MHGIGYMSFGRAEKTKEDQNESEMSNYRKQLLPPPRGPKGRKWCCQCLGAGREALWFGGAGCTGRGERSPWTVLPRDITVGKGHSHRNSAFNGLVPFFKIIVSKLL